MIGLGRTVGGDFLSSEDVELLESLASYIGIALQNASLYARLEEKISEFERLKEFNENIVESINVGIFAIDLEDRIESWNAQMEAMYAVSRAEALGQTLGAVFPDGIRRGHRRLPQRARACITSTSSASPREPANSAPPTSPSRRCSRATSSSVGRIVLVDDITERVSLETQLAQADKLSSIGLLAAGVAHEINTPLAVISSYAQMLSKQMRGDARLGPVLDKITQQSFRASEIANGLLNFSRTSTTEFRETNLNQVIRDTLSLLEHQFKTAQIIVDLELAEELPPIHGNPGKAAAGLSQPASERQRSHAGRRPPARRHAGQRPRGGGGLRLRLRHRARTSQAHLRSLLHHKDHAQTRRQAWHRTWTFRFLRHHSGARRQDSCRKRSRRRHNLPP